VSENFDRYALTRHLGGEEFVDLVKARNTEFDRLLTESVKADGTDGQPDTFVQWKGCNMCLDFNCPCGNGAHLCDAEFMYNVECPDCGRRWEIAPQLLVRQVQPGGNREGGAGVFGEGG